MAEPVRQKIEERSKVVIGLLGEITDDDLYRRLRIAVEDLVNAVPGYRLTFHRSVPNDLSSLQ